MPLIPRKNSLHNPASFVAAQAPAILRFSLLAVRLVRSNHLDALFSKLLVERVAVVGAITDQILRPCFDHVEVEAQLHERVFANPLPLVIAQFQRTNEFTTL